MRWIKGLLLLSALFVVFGMSFLYMPVSSTAFEAEKLNWTSNTQVHIEDSISISPFEMPVDSFEQYLKNQIVQSDTTIKKERQ